MSKILSFTLFFLLLMPATVVAQMIPLGKPTFCLPMTQMWAAYKGDENEVMLYTAVHVNSEHPIMTYWNVETDVVSTIEYVDVELEDQFGNIKEQQLGCVVSIGQLTSAIDFDSIEAKKLERNK